MTSWVAMKRNLTKTTTILFWPFFCVQPGRVPSRPLGPMPRGASGGERAALESLLRQMEQQRVGRNSWKSLSTPTSYCTSTFVFLGTKMWTPPPLIRTHPLFLTFSFVWVPPQLVSHLFSSQVPHTASSCWEPDLTSFHHFFPKYNYCSNLGFFSVSNGGCISVMESLLCQKVFLSFLNLLFNFAKLFFWQEKLLVLLPKTNATEVTADPRL